MSLPARGAWIETVLVVCACLSVPGRSPHGGRGLKPVRRDVIPVPPRRSPHGGRGLKLKYMRGDTDELRRSPHGGRGLKPGQLIFYTLIAMSLPARGAWIETTSARCRNPAMTSRSPHGGRGLKHIEQFGSAGYVTSLPARGAWIETFIPANVNILI